MSDLKEQFEGFTRILSDEKLEQEQTKKYGVENKRERKLLIKVFFWLMVLSAVHAWLRGCLSNDWNIYNIDID